MKFVFAVLLVCTLAATASAQGSEDKPLATLDRVSVAAGLNYMWYSAPFDTSDPVPAFSRGFEVGVYGAYNLTPHLSLTGSVSYMLDNKQLEQRLGLRFRLYQGKE